MNTRHYQLPVAGYHRGGLNRKGRKGSFVMNHASTENTADKNHE